MTPQMPAYLVTFESAVRPFVAAVALGLIWTGAIRMEGPAQSRYTTAGALSVTLIAWLAIAQYLGSANMYFATTDNAVPTLLFGLPIPLMIAAAGLWLSGSNRKPRLRDTATLDRGGSGLSHRRRHIPRPLGRRTPALAIRAARRDWGRYDRLPRRRRGCAAGAKCGRRPQRGLRLVPFRNRRSGRGDYNGGNDVSWAGASLGLRGAEPPHLILSAGDDPHFRSPAGPDAPRPSSVAAEAGERLDGPDGRGVIPLARSTTDEGGQVPPSFTPRSRGTRTA